MLLVDVRMDTRLVHPFTCIVAGPTGCGKTTFVSRILLNSTVLINLPPETLTWCYGEWQPLYATFAATQNNINFVQGLPDVTLFDPKLRNAVVIDDLMNETDDRITKLFTKKSHHCNTSVIYLVQNLFSKGKENRTISLNAQYMVLFKNPRDATRVVDVLASVYIYRPLSNTNKITNETCCRFTFASPATTQREMDSVNVVLHN